jgi:phage terminase large subunit-like protein
MAMEWSTAVPDWEDRVRAGRSLIALPPLFPEEAQANLDVFSALRIVDAVANGIVSPTMGEACRPWVTEFVSSVFGSYDPDSGRRLINQFLLLISKKNAKSVTAAGIMLTALIRNWRQSAEFLILAPTIEIANNSFWPARDMIKADPELRALLKVQEHYRTITHRKTDATLKVVAADTDTVGGKKAVGVLVDELWIFGKRANAANMLLEATGGLASRPEGFVIYLSTQSDEGPAGVFAEKLEYARGVRDGLIKDPKFLPVLYEFPKDMLEAEAYLDPVNFHITNPNLGASVDEEFLQQVITQAQNGSEESLQSVLAKHLNVEIGLSLNSRRWAGANWWERQARPGITLAELISRCEVIDVGIDGGGLDDLLGFAAAGRDKVTKEWLAYTHAWVHESALKLRKKDAPRLLDFQKDGDLTIVKQVGDDVDELVGMVKQVHDSGRLDKIGVDPHGIGSITAAIVAAKIPKELIIGITQGWKMVGAVKTGERKLADGSLIHGGQRLMNWCVGNAKVVPAGNAVLITKQASGAGKIDPLMALLDAITLLSLEPEPPRKAEYQMFTLSMR